MAEYTLQPSPILRTHKNVSGISVSNLWTPTVTCDTPGDLSVSYTVRGGEYVRIGELLILSINLLFRPTFTTATGSLIISGRPFFSDVALTFDGVGVVNVANIALPAGYSWMTIDMSSAVDEMVLTASGSDVLRQSISMAEIDSGDQVGINATVIQKLNSVS